MLRGSLTSVVMAAACWDAFTPFATCAATLTVTMPAMPWFAAALLAVPVISAEPMNVATVLMLIAPPVVNVLSVNSGIVRLTLYDEALAVPDAPTSPVGQVICVWTWSGLTSVQLPVPVSVTPSALVSVPVMSMAMPWRSWVQVTDTSGPAWTAVPASNAAERRDKNNRMRIVKLSFGRGLAPAALAAKPSRACALSGATGPLVAQADEKTVGNPPTTQGEARGYSM